MGAFSRILIASCLWLATPAWAEDAPKPPAATKPAEPPKPPSEEQRTLESFGRDNAACREWSDGCAVCLRTGDGAQACSLPGIACTPAAITCRHDADKAPDKPDQPDKPDKPAK